MNDENQIGAGLALIFAIVGFIISLYDIFSAHSLVHGSAGAWWVGLFTLLALIFSGSMFTSKHPSLSILAIISVIIAGLISIYLQSWWLLICMVISLIGCIIQMCYSVSGNIDEAIEDSDSDKKDKS
jgi:hypothetical protein